MKTHPILPLLFLTAISVFAAPQEKIPETDRIRIAETYRLASAYGNRLWPEWDKAPLAVLLVTPTQEFLIRHPRPSDDFTAIPVEKPLDGKIFRRDRKFAPDLLATFPAVGGVPTMVVGQAENTLAKASTRWVITLLHEHFHQYQNAQPGYYADVDALGLAKGDTTGMWMLNYDFPYAKPEVHESFAAMSESLAAALHARGKKDFAEKAAAYWDAKKKFKAALSADDYKYFAFQAWQEGVARYTEHHVAQWAAKEYEPTDEFQKLKDYRPFKEEAAAIFAGIERELLAPQLKESKRTAFYAIGAAEGLLLDELHPKWRDSYFKEKFSLDAHGVKSETK